MLILQKHRHNHYMSEQQLCDEKSENRESGATFHSKTPKIKIYVESKFFPYGFSLPLYIQPSKRGVMVKQSLQIWTLLTLNDVINSLRLSAIGKYMTALVVYAKTKSHCLHKCTFLWFRAHIREEMSFSISGTNTTWIILPAEGYTVLRPFG